MPLLYILFIHFKKRDWQWILSCCRRIALCVIFTCGVETGGFSGSVSSEWMVLHRLKSGRFSAPPPHNYTLLFYKRFCICNVSSMIKRFFFWWITFVLLIDSHPQALSHSFIGCIAKWTHISCCRATRTQNVLHELRKRRGINSGRVRFCMKTWFDKTHCHCSVVN